MTSTPYEPDVALDQYPLSFTQEFFCTFDQGDQGGAFSFRFIMVSGIRITGKVDVDALQGALDDVVARHELLRSVVVRDASPPYMQVNPACSVPLEIRDLPDHPGKSREIRAEELIIEAEQRLMNPRQPPLLRAALSRFDDRDSVLVLTAHHSAFDGWSMQLVIHDIAAYYLARTGGNAPHLGESRQYREFAAWQRDNMDSLAGDDARAYWREKLAGARAFALPNDRPTPDRYSSPFSIHNYHVDDEVVSRGLSLAVSTRSSLFMVLMAAFHVMAFHIDGITDSTIRSFTSGRNEPEFHDTVGPFMNLVPFRTDISGCTSFRDVVVRTRDTCVEAYEHEIPVNHLEAEVPTLNLLHEDPRRSQFIVGMFEPQFDDSELLIAEDSHEIHDRVLPEPENPDIPNGLVWFCTVLNTGKLTCGIQYNLDEFDEATVVAWGTEFRQILTAALNEPDREWKSL
jgi:condensation enzyme